MSGPASSHAVVLTLSPKFAHFIPSHVNHARVAVVDGSLRFLPTARQVGTNLPRHEVFADINRHDSGQLEIVAKGLSEVPAGDKFNTQLAKHGWIGLKPITTTEGQTDSPDVTITEVEITDKPKVYIARDGSISNQRRRGRPPLVLTAAQRARYQACSELERASPTSDLSVSDLANRFNGMIAEVANGDPNIARLLSLQVGTAVIGSVIDGKAEPEPEPIALPASPNNNTL